MSDRNVREQICDKLRERGKIVVCSHGELRHATGIKASNRVFKQALGRLIEDGTVIREREHIRGCSDWSERPITFTLSVGR